MPRAAGYAGQMLERVRSAVGRPQFADICLAVVFAVGGLVEIALTASGHFAVLIPFVLVTAIPIAWRRRHPFPAILIALAGVALGEQFGYPGNATYLLLLLVVAFFSLGAWVELRASAWRAASGMLVVWLLIASDEPGLDNFVFVTLFYGGAWLVGVLVRRPRQRAGELEEAAAAKEAAHHQAVVEIVQAERARIARELHDVVAHNVSVMVIQAGAVRHRLADQHDRERSALEVVERAGREALDEMRRLLGILRTDADAQASLLPAPGVHDLERLIEQVRAAGVPVDYSLNGDREMPAGVGLAVYRVVQEALTNVLKHAAGAPTTVTVDVGPRAVDLVIHDRGEGLNDNRPGHGLVGMRERVAVYGGTFSAGPGEGGGFAVRAHLPVQEHGA
jgi:signal transduction histidine kinase